MRKCSSWFAVVAAALAACQIALAKPESGQLAILTDVSGSVQIVRGGKALPGKSGMRLQAGDTVRVANGSATVFYNGRPPQVLRKGQQVKVAAAMVVASNAGMWRNAYAGISSGFERRAEELPSMLRDDRLNLVYPVNSRVLESRPVLQWEPFTQGGFEVADYQVTITDASGESNVWQGYTKDTFLKYPASAPALQPGQRYKWYVTPRQKVEDGAPEPGQDSRQAWLEIATPEDAAAMNTDIAQLSAEAKDLPENMRRTVQAAAMTERGFNADAMLLLTPDLTRDVLGKERYREKMKETLPKMDETSRALLRNIYADTKQFDLVKQIDTLAPVPVLTDNGSAALSDATTPISK